MHIPDGLISPQTYLPALAVALPLWVVAGKKLRVNLGDTMLPKLAVFTALSLILSTLMIPLPGGTSGHAVGVALLALVFGPWTAFLAYSLTLLLQALVMGAGGITALPINALAMGFIGAWLTWSIFRILEGIQSTLAVLVAVWVSIMVSAALIAMILGLQPWIASDNSGSPLFFPFGPEVTLPALLIPHLLIASGEAVLTLVIFRHAQKRGWLELRV